MQVTQADQSRPGGFLRPFHAFFALESASGILLMLAAAVALVWANSPWSGSYFNLLGTHFGFTFGDATFQKTLLHWINDGLMAIFFFVVGLEIKREILAGELSSVKAAALPLTAAVGGMVVPAGVYVLWVMTHNGENLLDGWAVPMATDIAFALGVLALLGKRAPLGLKIFLTALAIADDLGAVLVIAFFYTASLSHVALAWAGGILALLVIANVAGVRKPMVYVILGICMWVAVYKSGIHATVAGVLTALAVPATGQIDTRRFSRRLSEHLSQFDEEENAGLELTPDQRHAVLELKRDCEEMTSPLRYMEHVLHPWVAFVIMPIFALANAGVALGGDMGATLTQPVTLAVLLGLWIGKPIGVFSFAYVAVKVGFARLPNNTNWQQVFGVSCLCGIGFTMSLFIASLAFEDAFLLDSSKIGIFAASVLSALGGALLIITASRKPQPTEPHAGVM